MRPIKFRVWNGEVMISPDYIDRNGLAHWKENSIPTTSDKLMQFTGLLDKKGKEIYEGDIVEFTDPLTVYLNGKKTQIKERALIHYEGLGFYAKGWCHGSREAWICASKEVIGNIYESKHLLKETPNE